VSVSYDCWENHALVCLNSSAILDQLAVDVSGWMDPCGCDVFRSNGTARVFLYLNGTPAGSLHQPTPILIDSVKILCRNREYRLRQQRDGWF